MAIVVLCPTPECGTTFELTGILDLGYMAETGYPQGFTEARLGADCPACSTHFEFHLPVEWRKGS